MEREGAYLYPQPGNRRNLYNDVTYLPYNKTVSDQAANYRGVLHPDNGWSG